MARYIDADKANEGIEAIQTSLESNDDREWRKNKPYYKGLAWARGVINETPAADVAPRAEVAREIFEEIEELFRQHKEGGYYLNGAWYPERLDLYTEDAFEALKNKYAEGRNERADKKIV